MSLGVRTYETIDTLEDDYDRLNLAWTSDERAWLAVDLNAHVTRELEREVQSGLAHVYSYFVKDPYGEDLLRPVIAAFFSKPACTFSVTCGAGVNSLLSALSGPTRGRNVEIVGDALWAVREAWALHRDIARASGPQTLTAVPAEELDALTAGYDPLIEARELSVADKRRLPPKTAEIRHPSASAAKTVELQPNGHTTNSRSRCRAARA